MPGTANITVALPPLSVSICPPLRRWTFDVRCWTLSLLLAASIADARPVSNVTFVSFDLETTGFSVRYDRIIEIGVVKFRNGKILESRSWLLNPGIPIPQPAQRIHGITEEMTTGRPSFQDIFPEFTAFIGNAVLLAHNASFEVKFINAELERNGLPPPGNAVLDTLRLSRAWFPDAESYSLKNLIGYLNITEGTFHRALADSRYVTDIFLAGLAKAPPGSTLESLSELAGGTMRFAGSDQNRIMKQPQ